MKLIRTQDAVGQVLCHDLTQIIKDVKKDAVFRKGHIVTEEDIPVLLSIGKEHLYVWEKKEGQLHENEGAELLRQMAQGRNLTATEPREGKISLLASCDGLLKIRSEKLLKVNSIGEVMIATKRGNTFVQKGQNVAGMRIIPLVIDERKMEEARAAAGDQPIVDVIPLKKKKAVILATGSEIFKGRIKDTFTPVVEGKLTELGAEILDRKILDDNSEVTTRTILEEIENGAEIVCVTGGMSVDPDDKTPLAIRSTGARVVSYGAPVLPGAMFMLAYYEKNESDGKKPADEEKEDPDDAQTAIPIVGLPGCVMYAGRTVFDLILPRLLADDPVTPEELAALGEGGLL